MTPRKIKLTASQIDRFINCPGSADLPKVRGVRSEAADIGTQIHEKILLNNDQPNDFFLWNWLRQEIDDKTHRCEVEHAFVMSDQTHQSLGNLQQHRRYPNIEGSWIIGGTMDAGSFIVQNGRIKIRIIDLKTGYGQNNGSLPPPDKSWQLRTLATVWWNTLECPKDIDIKLAWGIWNDQAATGKIVETDVIGSDILDQWNTELRELAELIVSGSKEYSRGNWCKFCRSFDFCPAQKEALSKIYDVPEDLGALEEGKLVEVWNNLTAAENQTKNARESLTKIIKKKGKINTDKDSELIAIQKTMRKIKDVEKVKQEAGLTVSKEITNLESIKDGFINAGKDADEFIERMEKCGAIEKTYGENYLQERRVR